MTIRGTSSRSNRLSQSRLHFVFWLVVKLSNVQLVLVMAGTDVFAGVLASFYPLMERRWRVGIWVMTEHLIALICDVLCMFYPVLFHLHTFTFVALNSLIVLFCVCVEFV